MAVSVTPEDYMGEDHRDITSRRVRIQRMEGSRNPM